MQGHPLNLEDAVERLRVLACMTLLGGMNGNKILFCHNKVDHGRAAQAFTVHLAVSMPFLKHCQPSEGRRCCVL